MTDEITEIQAKINRQSIQMMHCILPPTELIRVYKNLNRNCFSVQRYYKGSGWRLWNYLTYLPLDNAVFKVYQSGRKRVVETGIKNVHAYVLGCTNSNMRDCMDIENKRRVSYDPKQFEQFRYCDNNEFIYKADKAIMRLDGIYV